MRVLSFYRPKVPASGPPSAEHMMKMGAFATEMTEKGHLIAAGGFLGQAPGIHARLSNGDFSVSDAPNPAQGFEGFGYLQAPSREELNALIRRFLEVAGDGECVIWPCMEGPPQPE